MTTKDDIGPLLVEAVPVFTPLWNDMLAEWRATGGRRDRVHPANALQATLTDYLWENLLDGKTELFPAIFSVFEHIVTDEDRDPSPDSAYNPIVIGLYEDVQHRIQDTRGRTRDPDTVRDRESFTTWLGPASRRAWREEAGVWTRLYDPPGLSATNDRETRNASARAPKRSARKDRVTGRRAGRR